jgi:hypothetical protein
MIVMEINGGLGNQMFQYAVGWALAAARRTELKLDISSFDIDRPAEFAAFPRKFKLQHFQITAVTATKDDIARTRDRYAGGRLMNGVARRIRRRWPTRAMGFFEERMMCFDSTVLALPDQTYLRGYFQSESYFKAVADEIRRQFRPRDAAMTEFAANYVAKRRQAAKAVVSLHVRRGDLAQAAEVLKDRTIIQAAPVSVEYVHAAMARFAADSTFLVFSDSDKDLDWCRANIRGQNLHFCYGNNDLQDFAIMQACDDHIIANSSFSWWAAWLNPRPGKRVVAPRQWHFSDYNPTFRIESLIPPSWELLST